MIVCELFSHLGDSALAQRLPACIHMSRRGDPVSSYRAINLGFGLHTGTG